MKLAQFKPSATFPLVARYCRDSLAVVFGCQTCIDALRNGYLCMPPRYKNPQKCHAFAHWNVPVNDAKRAVDGHPICKSHKKACGVPVVELRENSAEESDRNDILLNHFFLAVRKLVKLKPAQCYIDAVAECREVSGAVDCAKWGSRPFYDKVMHLANTSELSRLIVDLSKSPFKDAFVVGADAKDQCNQVRIYYVAPPNQQNQCLVQQRCLDCRKLHRLNNVWGPLSLLFPSPIASFPAFPVRSFPLHSPALLFFVFFHSPSHLRSSW